MGGRTFDDETREQLRVLHAQGLSCNAIAKALRCSSSTVSLHAKRLGLSFDRARTELAVRARMVDLAEGRTSLVQKMLVVASDLLDSVDRPYLVHNFGGKDNTFAEHLLDAPPVEVTRSIVVTAGIAVDKANRVLERDNGGLDDAVGVIDQLAAGFRAAADMYRSETVPETVDESG